MQRLVEEAVIEWLIANQQLLSATCRAGIPLLVGTNLEEYKFYRRMDGAAETLTDETLLARLADPRIAAEAGDGATVDPAEAVALYRRERASRGESAVAPELWFAIMTDRRFRVPSMRLAELHAAHRSALTPTCSHGSRQVGMASAAPATK
jgi:carboxylesterase type B